MLFNNEKKKTANAFNNPKRGMRFHEMYSFWVYVLIVSPEGIITVRTFSGHPANPYRETNKVITYGSLKEFQEAYRYKSNPNLGYWVSYIDDLAFARMPLEEMVDAADLERGYTLPREER